VSNGAGFFATGQLTNGKMSFIRMNADLDRKMIAKHLPFGDDLKKLAILTFSAHFKKFSFCYVLGVHWFNATVKSTQ